MILYAESSAVLSWLFGEPAGEEMLRLLKGAEFVVTSDLTLVECHRALERARSLEQLSEDVVHGLQNLLDGVATTWVPLRLSDEILQRARGPFPEEPIRALDALHLATALHVAALFPQVRLLSLDDRVRRSAQGLELQVLPPS